VVLHPRQAHPALETTPGLRAHAALYKTYGANCIYRVLSYQVEVALITRNESHSLAVYMPGSALKSSLASIRQLARDSIRSRNVIWEMFKRDLTSQYRQSILGVLFSLLPPLAITAWAMLFRNAHLINVGRSSVPYPFFVLCGMMVWAAFFEALNGPISGSLSEQSLLSKASIPPKAVTFARLGQVFFNSSVKTLVVAVAASFYSIHVRWTAALAPLSFSNRVAMPVVLDQANS